MKKYQEAIPFYKKSLIINPQNPYAIYLLGQTYIILGDKKESKRLDWGIKILKMNLNKNTFAQVGDSLISTSTTEISCWTCPRGSKHPQLKRPNG